MSATLVAAGMVVRRPELWAVALAGFLARGGIVPLLLPFIVLPDIVGLTTFVGANAITAAGPSPGFVGLIVSVILALVAWLLLGTLAGCLVDVHLVRAALEWCPAADRSGADTVLSTAAAPSTNAAAPSSAVPSTVAVPQSVALPSLSRRMVAGLVAIRLLSVLPLGAALGWGVFRLVEVGYRELILPGNLAVPFPIRVLQGAPDVVLALAITWFVGELLGAVATRLAILGRRTVGRAPLGAAWWVARHPGVAFGTVLATTAGSLLLVLPLLFVAGAAWQAVLAAFLATTAGGAAALPAAVAVVAFSAAWVASLVLAGIAAAWRSASWSRAILDD